jgi:hypothetical protein
MTKTFLFLSLFFFSFVSGFALQDPDFDKGIVVSKKASSNRVDLSINLGKIAANDQLDVQMIDKVITSELQSYSAELTCSVTVTAEVSVGVAKFTISVSVSGPCGEIRRNGTNIANQIINDVKSRLSNYK